MLICIIYNYISHFCFFSLSVCFFFFSTLHCFMFFHVLDFVCCAKENKKQKTKSYKMIQEYTVNNYFFLIIKYSKLISIQVIYNTIVMVCFKNIQKMHFFSFVLISIFSICHWLTHAYN